MRIIVPSLKIFQANFFHEMKLNNKAEFERNQETNPSCIEHGHT